MKVRVVTTATGTVTEEWLIEAPSAGVVQAWFDRQADTVDAGVDVLDVRNVDVTDEYDRSVTISRRSRDRPRGRVL